MGGVVPIVIAAGSLAASFIAVRKLSEKRKPDTIFGKLPVTEAERGAYVPLVIGRERVGGVLLAEYTRRIAIEDTQQTGGKGAGAGGAGNGSEVTYSRVFMGLTVGPARRLRSIEMNGERIWPIGESFLAGITPDSHPSGSRLSLGGDPSAGSFVIYWGEANQPGSPELGNNGFPVQTRFPHLCYIAFDELRLGSQGTVPSLVFDIEVAPYKSTYDFGASYLTLPFDLPGSDGWFRNGRVFDRLVDYPALIYLPFVGEIKVGGDARGGLGVGETFALRYINSLAVIGQSQGVTYDPTEVISVPPNINLPIPASTPRLVSDSDVAPGWVFLGAVTRSRVFGQWDIPGFGTGAVLNDAAVYSINCTGPFLFGARTLPGSIVPPGAINEFDAGDKRNTATFYLRVPEVSSTVEIFFWFTEQRTLPPPNSSSIEAKIRFRPGRVVEVVGAPSEGVIGSAEAVGNNWYRCVISCDIAFNNPLRADEDLFLAFQGGFCSFEFAFGTGRRPNVADPFWSYQDSNVVVGVSTVSVDIPLSAYEDFNGRLTLYRFDPEAGDHGANAAHIINQLLFEAWPHGLGMSTERFDMASLEAVGVEMEAEGLRCHAVADGQPIASVVSTVMAEVGISIAWDHTQGKFAFRLERSTGPDASVLFHSVILEPLGTTRLFDEGRVNMISYEFTSAAEEFVTHSVDVDQSGTQSLSSGGSVRSVRIESARDIETGQRLAAIMANLDFSQASLKSFRLGRDGIVTRAGDLLDFSSWTRSPQSWRVASITGATHTPEVEVTAFEDRLDYGVPSLSGFALTAEQTNETEPEADIAVWAFEDGGTLSVARLPANRDMVYGEVLGSNDGTSFWKLGAVATVAGGLVADDSGDQIWLRTRVPEDMAKLMRVPDSAAASGVLRGTTTDEAGWTFQGVEDLGRGLWRVYGISGMGRVPIDVEAEPGKHVFLWIDGTLPTVTGGLPTEPTRSYRVEARKRGSTVQIQDVDLA